MSIDICGGEGNGNPLQYSCMENPMGGGAWWAAVHGVARSQTRLSDFTFTFHFHALEKAMATHSSVLAWRIPGTGEPGGLLPMGSHRVGLDWSNLAAAAADICGYFLGSATFQFSHSVINNSLRLHGLQHASPPYPSPTPRLYSNFMSIELVMPSNHFIPCRPLLLLSSIFPRIRFF